MRKLKLFSLIVCTLFATQMWADPTIPSGTLTLPTTGLMPFQCSALKWTGAPDTLFINETTSPGYVIFSPYAIRQSAQTWATKVSSNIGSANGTWEGTDIFKGTAFWKVWASGDDTSSKNQRYDTFKKNSSDAYEYFRVTNCTGVKIFFATKHESSKKATMSLKVYEITGEPGAEVATEVTAAANSGEYGDSGTKILATNANLDKTKNYVIEVHATDINNKNNVSFHEIAFYYPVADVTAPTLSSSTPADEATDVAVSGNIVLTMSENVTVADASKFSLAGGAGSLTTADISVSGASITIPYTGLANSTEYTFTAAAGAIQDGAATPNTNAAFSFTFTTVVLKHTVTYYDGETNLGNELVVDGGKPTGAGLAPRKLGYTFAGWSTTNGGAAVALNTISVTANMSLFAVWNAVDCATNSGTIYTMSIAVAPLANCTITSTTGTHDLYQYEGVSGGEAILGNKGTSNNCILTTSKTIILKDDNSYLKLDFDCPLKEGDKIVYSVSNNNPFVSTATSKPSESEALAVLDRNKTEFVIPAASGLIDAQTIYFWKGGGNTTITSVNIVRPEKFAVTFNMHGHGDAVAAQYILDGGKVAEPATTDIEGWDFGGWYQTYVASPESYSDAWDFDNDVVSAATELHAKWTAHVASSDATLKALSVTGCTLNETFAPATTAYTITLPLGSSMPAVGDVTATKNDSHAEDPIVSITDNVITIACEAEDGTKLNYTITITYADIKDITLIWKPNTSTCGGGTVGSSTIKSDNASVSSYIKKITFTGGGTENAGSSGSLNVGNTAGNMFTLSTQTGYTLESLNFHGKIQDADCEYSIDGGDWTTLTSTNTSGDACYEIFSSTEVTEFRLRSTGTSGVWIRNMQLTIAAIPYAIKIDDDIENGSVVAKVGGVTATTATIGQTVNLTASPVSGYKLASYSVYETATPANIITVTDGSFTMPAAAVTVFATFGELFDITCAKADNGSVSADKAQAIAGETVTLTLSPASGYKVASVKVNDGEPLSVVGNEASFTMPAAAVTVTATFSVATALDNTEAGVKAVKRLENGMLVIEKNGVRYNAQGQIIH